MTVPQRLAADFLRLASAPAALDTAIHSSDEMFATFRALGMADDVAEFEYFRSGNEVLLLLDHVLAHAGTRLSEQRSVLEFACGYGRLTRWLAHVLAPARVSSSDIMPEAVAHVAARHGVRAFVSDTQPEHVELGGPHDLIWVGSLFSHLPEPRFRAWLARLASALSPRGLLVFSTHGESLLASSARDERGFVFEAHSENARLAASEYGTSYARAATVAAWTRELGLAHLGCAERELWLTQDVHVVARASLSAWGTSALASSASESRERAAAGAPSLSNAPFARGRFELCSIDAHGFARVGGWVRTPRELGAPHEVELRIDAAHAFAAQLGEPLEQREGASRWIARPWLLEGELARFGRGTHSLCAFGRARDTAPVCFDARSLSVA